VSATPLPDLTRCSLNQMTIDQWSLDEAAAGCAEAGIGWIAPWRHKLGAHGAAACAATIRDAGLRVSSLCRGGFFAHADAARDDDNRRAVEEAAALGTDVLVLVCGPPAGRDLAAARDDVCAGIERLLPAAVEHGVRLAIEPLHPMMVAERSVIVTLREANDLASRFDPAWVGVIVDTYHVFWDADVDSQIARAGERIFGFHVSDWVTPNADPLACRAPMGDGIIDFRHLRGLVEAAGYDGPIEIEIINSDLHRRPGNEVLQLAAERFLAHV
jgi:sugar phosphate isomerase/epimerase